MAEKKKVTSTTATLDRLKASGQLAALTRKKPVAAEAATGSQEIPLDKIAADPEQPRRSFDQDKLVSLAESIKAQGILQPITVRPANEDGIHLIIMGERRFRASRLAGLTTVSALVKEVTPELRMAQLTENVQRDDLTTFEIARAVTAMREDGKTRGEIAVALGWSESMVSRFAAIMQLPAELLSLAEANVPARALSDLGALWSRDEQAVREFIEAVAPGEIGRRTVDELRERIAAAEIPQGGEGDAILPVEAGTGEAVEADGRERSVPEMSPGNADPEPREAPSGQGEPSRKPSRRGVALICKVGDDIGRIDTSTAADTAGCLVVRFDNGERIEDVPLDRVELVDVVPLE